MVSGKRFKTMGDSIRKEIFKLSTKVEKCKGVKFLPGSLDIIDIMVKTGMELYFEDASDAAFLKRKSTLIKGEDLPRFRPYRQGKMHKFFDKRRIIKVD